MALTQINVLPFLTIVLLIAAVSDIRFHKIPNWLTYSTVVLAIVYSTAMKGSEGFLFSVVGVVVGIAVLIPFYLMGGMGAGDVKLMGAVGGLLGPKGVFRAFLFTAIMGAIWALALLTFHGRLKETTQRFKTILRTFILTRQFIYTPSPEGEKRPGLCYGLVIASGTFISVVWRIWG